MLGSFKRARLTREISWPRPSQSWLEMQSLGLHSDLQNLCLGWSPGVCAWWSQARGETLVENVWGEVQKGP